MDGKKMKRSRKVILLRVLFTFVIAVALTFSAVRFSHSRSVGSIELAALLRGIVSASPGVLRLSERALPDVFAAKRTSGQVEVSCDNVNGVTESIRKRGHLVRPTIPRISSIRIASTSSSVIFSDGGPID